MKLYLLTCLLVSIFIYSCAKNEAPRVICAEGPTTEVACTNDATKIIPGGNEMDEAAKKVKNPPAFPIRSCLALLIAEKGAQGRFELNKPNGGDAKKLNDPIMNPGLFCNSDFSSSRACEAVKDAFIKTFAFECLLQDLNPKVAAHCNVDFSNLYSMDSFLHTTVAAVIVKECMRILKTQGTGISVAVLGANSPNQSKVSSSELFKNMFARYVVGGAHEAALGVNSPMNPEKERKHWERIQAYLKDLDKERTSERSRGEKNALRIQKKQLKGPSHSLMLK